MELTEQQLLARAMAGYERSRLGHAALAALPTLLLPLAAFVVGGRLLISASLGGALWVAVVLLTWRGQAWGLSVPAGLKAGVFPLAFALIAQKIGHICTGQGCTSLCVPMCAAGGLIAGFVISVAARRSPQPRLTLAGGAIITVAVGAMGCSCVGATGILGMGLGLALGATAAVVAARAR